MSGPTPSPTPELVALGYAVVTLVYLRLTSTNPMRQPLTLFCKLFVTFLVLTYLYVGAVNLVSLFRSIF